METCSSTLCVAGIVRDLGRNRKISTQKASIVTDIVAKDMGSECKTVSRVQGVGLLVL